MAKVNYPYKGAGLIQLAGATLYSLRSVVVRRYVPSGGLQFAGAAVCVVRAIVNRIYPTSGGIQMGGEAAYRFRSNLPYVGSGLIQLGGAAKYEFPVGCYKCKYWRPIQDNIGACHRFPPILHSFAGQPDRLHATTGSTDWCGEFVLKA